MQRKKKNGYERTIVFANNEIPAKVNLETGELITLREYKNNIPPSKQLFLPDEKFTKMYWASQYVWNHLADTLTDLEFRIAQKLSFYAAMNTNSLKPLNDKILLQDLSIEFDVSINRVGPVFKKLFKIGVYGNWEVSDIDNPSGGKFWVLNPYLGFAGKMIDQSLIEFFSKTYIAKIFFEGLEKTNGGKMKLKHIKD